MKIIRYLLKPVKLLVFLCLIAAVIYYRSMIFHPNINQYIDMADSYAEDQLNIVIPSYLPTDAQTSEQVIEAQKTTDEIGTGGTNEAYAMTEEECLEKQSLSRNTISNVNNENTDTTVNDSNENKPDFIEGLSVTLDLIDKKIDTLVNNNKTEPVTVTGNKNDDIDNHKNEISAVSSDVQSLLDDNNSFDMNKTREMARQSFWNGDIEISEKLYQDLIKHENNNPDTYGELGNVYYAQGKWKQAGEAYYEAAILLLDLNQRNQVGYLLRVIQGLDATSADKLRQKISG